MAARGKWLKLRGSVWWFQIAVPQAVQSIFGKAVVQESLRTADRKLAEHLALERAASWKRQFDLHVGVIRGNAAPRSIFLEVQQRVAWLKDRFRDRDELDLQLDLLWDEYAKPEARRLGLLDISEADPEDVAHDVAAALDAIKGVLSGHKEVPKEYGTPFSQLAADYIRDRQRDQESELTMQTVSQMEATYRLFRDHIADAPLATIDRRTVTAFLDKVKRLSPNWGRSPDTKRRTLEQLLAIYGKVTGPKVTNRTLNRYVSALYGLWEWSRNRDETSGENPFDGQWTKAKTRKDANMPWAEEPLKAVLALESSPGTPGNPNPLYWLPRIALLSGMRLNEVCSLEVADIKKADGVIYFDIPEGKTESAVRVVPVHSSLVEFLGLCPKAGFLFPNLKPGGPDKKRSWFIGREFGRSTGDIEGRSTFHGFRKNVVQTFERCRIPESEVAQIVGHGKKGITYRVYSPNGLAIQQKRELVELLTLPR